MKRKYLTINSRNAAMLALLTMTFATGSAMAASGNWITNGNSTWSNTANWTSGTIADGVGDTATFTLNLSANRTFTIDTTSRTLGTLNTSATGRSTNFATSGGAVLTMDNTGSTNAVINVDAASGQNHAFGASMLIDLMDSPILESIGHPNSNTAAKPTDKFVHQTMFESVPS